MAQPPLTLTLRGAAPAVSPTFSYVLLALNELPMKTLVMNHNPWDKSVVENKVVIYTPIVVYTLSKLERLDGDLVSEALRE